MHTLAYTCTLTYTTSSEMLHNKKIKQHFHKKKLSKTISTQHNDNTVLNATSIQKIKNTSEQ